MHVLIAHRCHDDGLDDPEFVSLPPALPWAAAAVRAAGHQATVVNFSRLGWRDVERFLGERRPDVLVATCRTSNRHAAVRLVRLARRSVPGVLTAVSGPHAEALAELLLRRVRELDVVLRGDLARATRDAVRAVVERGREGLDGLVGVVTRVSLDVGPSPPLELDALPAPLVGLEGAGIEPERDLATLVAATPAGLDGAGPRLRSVAGVVRDLRALRRRHGVLDVAISGAGLLRDSEFLPRLAEELAASKQAARWSVAAELAELVPGSGREAERALRRRLAAAHASGCREVRVDLDAAEDLRDGAPPTEALAAASRAVRDAGLAPHLTVRFGTVDGGPEEVAALRAAIRAFRPRLGAVRPRELLAGSADWARIAERRELDDSYWFDEPRDLLLVASPRRIEEASAALELTLRDACRSGAPVPRDLTAVEARLGNTAWMRIDWGDYWAAHGDRAEAERHYRAAAALEPWNPFPWLQLAISAARGARPDEGLEREALREVLARVPTHEASRARLRRLKERRRRQR